jgi:hypothetical protein
MKITLMTTMFNGPRIGEFQYCVEQNLANPAIGQVVILFDNFDLLMLTEEQTKFLNYPRIIVRNTTFRPTYKTFIDIANTEFPESIICISNADVYFDSTLEKILPCSFDNTIYGITRIVRNSVLKLPPGIYEHQNSGSQDAWIFKTPLKQFESNIVVGIIGCDSYFTQKAMDVNIKMINPCLSINLWHHHGRRAGSSVFPDGTSYWKGKNAPDYHGYSIPYSSL